jgi:hypothetical protein
MRMIGGMSAGQVIEDDALASPAVVVEGCIRREEPLKHEAVDECPHHRACVVEIQLTEGTGLDAVVDDLPVAATASVIKSGVEVVKTLIARANADEVGIGEEELTALMRIGEDRIDCRLDLLNRVVDPSHCLTDPLMDPFDDPFERTQKEILFRREIVECGAFTHASALRDVLQCDCRIAFLGHLLIGRLDQLLAPQILIFLDELFCCHLYSKFFS